MKVGLAQINPRVGDFARNRERAVRRIEEARARSLDLLVFPELSVTGYPPRDLVDFDTFVAENLQTVDAIAAAARGMTVVCGFVEPNPSPVGRPFFNSAAVLKDGKRITTYHKRLLPYYDVFDESRYFEPGNAPAFFEVAGKRVALTICEDAWNLAPFTKRPYPTTPLEELRGESFDLLVNLSASPFFLGRPADRMALYREITLLLGVPALFCNQVGGNDELLFDGCSFLMSRSGLCVTAAKAFEEDFLSCDLNHLEVGHQCVPPWPECEGEWLRRALATGLRDYVEKCGAKQVCLGLSGGIDSAVVAALAADCLGAQNVSAISLPTRFTSSPSQQDAEQLARDLGIAFRTVPIQKLFNSYLELWKETFGTEPKGLTQENLQPRIRMTLLMALANEENRLLLNTSNKSEIATGYATLYGDSAGALAVLGDLTKHQVYALARHYNRHREVIPRRILERAPTAELKENQTDQDTLPPYDVLDPMVKRAIEEQRSPSELAREFDPKWVQVFARLHPSSEYKRRQLPPVLRVSSKAIGMGRRIPIAAQPAK